MSGFTCALFRGKRGCPARGLLKCYDANEGQGSVDKIFVKTSAPASNSKEEAHCGDLRLKQGPYHSTPLWLVL